MKLITPPDGWGPWTPRNWQAKADGVLVNHFVKPKPERAIIRAIMGSGKSILMAQFLARCLPSNNEVIVVTTSSIYLVEQLARTIRERLEPNGGIMARQKVGLFYTHGKDVTQPVIITCIPSAPELARILEANGRRCGLWLCDESHKSRSNTIEEMYSILRPDNVLGMTATPYRSDEKERLTLFDKLIYSYGPKEAISDHPSPIVPWRIMPWTGGEATLDEACHIMSQNMHGPGMFNATSIADAENFVQFLRTKGINSDVVHSELSRSTIKARLKLLEKGEISSIVHVAMLQEGADFPWLRWLCMRRPVGSRVRFVQELGRVLRSWTDPKSGEIKNEAYILDPHDLMGQMALEYEAVIGGDYLVSDDDNTEEAEARRKERELEQQVFELMRHLTEVKAGQAPLSMSPLSAYLRELIVAFDTCGLLERKIVSRSWRTQPMSPKQANAIDKFKRVVFNNPVPRLHQKALGGVVEHVSDMNRGTASDLISIMMAIGDNRKWPDFKPLDAAASEGIQRHEERKLKNTTTVPALPGDRAVCKNNGAEKAPVPTLFDNVGMMVPDITESEM
jgi:superfamily II DNA or RNA helicase